MSDRRGDYYTFTSSDGTTVRMLRGEGTPTMTGGGGGWEIESRQRRVGLTVWNGREPYQMDIPILFDGFAIGRSQEDAISILNQMQMGKDLKEPPTVSVSGGLPIKGNIDWVISNIDWGDNVLWDTDAVSNQQVYYRLRQDAVVHLIQYNPEDRLKVAKGGNLRAPRRYVVKQGDDLRVISQKMYGTPNRYKDIQKANGLRDAKKVTKMVGKEIRIPA